MREILAFYVSPMHGTPIRAVRMILEEYVIFAVKHDKSVRIVYPTLAAGYVKLGKSGVVYKFA